MIYKNLQHKINYIFRINKYQEKKNKIIFKISIKLDKTKNKMKFKIKIKK